MKCKAGDRWAEIVLTAFAKLLTAQQTPIVGRDYPKLDFSTIEWIYAGVIGERLSSETFRIFTIKPGMPDAKGRVQIGAPIATAMLDRQLQALRGHPATAYTNRCIHIWALLDYDAAHKRVYARNPRRTQGEWMSLGEFRERFQLLVYAGAPVSGNA